MRKKVASFIWKLGQSSSNFLNFEYLLVMHAVASLSEVGYMIGKDSTLNAAHIKIAWVIDNIWRGANTKASPKILDEYWIPMSRNSMNLFGKC